MSGESITKEQCILPALLSGRSCPSRTSPGVRQFIFSSGVPGTFRLLPQRWSSEQEKSSVTKSMCGSFKRNVASLIPRDLPLHPLPSPTHFSPPPISQPCRIPSPIQSQIPHRISHPIPHPITYVLSAQTNSIPHPIPSHTHRFLSPIPINILSLLITFHPIQSHILPLRPQNTICQQSSHPHQTSNPTSTLSIDTWDRSHLSYPYHLPSRLSLLHKSHSTYIPIHLIHRHYSHSTPISYIQLDR